jgi:hypothetical protein
MSQFDREHVLKSTRRLLMIICALCGVFAFIAIAPLAFSLLIGRTKPGPGHIGYFSVMALSFGAPAVLYAIVSVNLTRRRAWAAVMGIVVASIHAVAALLVIGFAIYAYHFVGPVLLIPATTALVMGAMSIAIIKNIARLFGTLHELSPDESTGFAPIIRP